MKRIDGRAVDEARPVKVTRDFLKNAEGSVLFELGGTEVICAASIENKVPPWLRGQGTGWVTAEYSMLPRATTTRTGREVNRGRPGGRTQEIQRLIGRSLRSVVDLNGLGGEVTIMVDCDVINADGGTRTASITGAFIALYDALMTLRDEEKIEALPLSNFVAATSVGVLDGKVCLDLNYPEDFAAEVDMNVVMNGSGNIVEIQGTAEKADFSKEALDEMLDLAGKGINELIEMQRSILVLKDQ